MTRPGSLSPAGEALAYRIWAYAKPRGWECTALDVADALGESTRRIRRVVQAKGWAGRLPHGNANREEVAAAGPDDLVEHFARSM